MSIHVRKVLKIYVNVCKVYKCLGKHLHVVKSVLRGHLWEREKMAL